MLHRLFIVIAASLLILLVACEPEEELDPVVVFVTATSDARTPTPFPTLTAISSFPTATLTAVDTDSPSPTVFESPTAIEFPTATSDGNPTAFPTITAVPPSATPINLEDLPAFPTATPSATIEGVPSPTNIPLGTATEAATNVPAITAPTIAPDFPQPTATTGEVAVFVPPDSLGELEILPPSAVSNLAPKPEQLPVIVASRVGIQLHPFVTNEEWDNALNLTEQLKFGWIKFQMPWDVAEPSPGQYSFEYERLVLLVQQAHIDGFKVLIGVTRAPDWARPQGADLSQEGPPVDPAAFANFITKLATDIKPEFFEAIEVWNEPNLMREWQGAEMNGATYMRYFEAAYNAAKAVDPEVIVVTAGLAPVGDIPGSAVDDGAFLRQMYAAGLKNFPDARIGVHPYGWANPPDARCCSSASWSDNAKFFMLETIDAYREITLSQGEPDRQMWITEIGWGTYRGINADGGDHPPPDSAQFFDFTTLEEQAQFTVRALELLQSEAYVDFMERVFLWNMNFATIEGIVEQRNELAGYSLLNAGGTPRLVFYYLLNTRKAYEKDELR